MSSCDLSHECEAVGCLDRYVVQLRLCAAKTRFRHRYLLTAGLNRCDCDLFLGFVLVGELDSDRAGFCQRRITPRVGLDLSLFRLPACKVRLACGQVGFRLLNLPGSIFLGLGLVQLRLLYLFVISGKLPLSTRRACAGR